MSQHRHVEFDTTRSAQDQTPTCQHPTATTSRLVIRQTVFPAYRLAFFTRLSAEWRGTLTVQAGEHYFEPSVRSVVSPDVTRRGLKNCFLFGRRALFQWGGTQEALAADVLVLEFNPRILTTWYLLCFRRVLGRRTALWGHSRSRHVRPVPSAIQGGRVLRRLLYQLSDHLLVYTRTEADQLRKRDTAARVTPACNALYEFRKYHRPATAPTDLVVSGRLTSGKRPLAAVHAFAECLPSLPSGARLHFLGDGPMLEDLHAEVVAYQLEERVVIHGAVYDEKFHAHLYGSALGSVCAGYLGLNLIQSLWFGVPMIFAADQPHSPEVEAAEPDMNCLIYCGNEPHGLASAISSLYRRQDEWVERRAHIAEQTRAAYSLESMVANFIAAATTPA